MSASLMSPMVTSFSASWPSTVGAVLPAGLTPLNYKDGWDSTPTLACSTRRWVLS